MNKKDEKVLQFAPSDAVIYELIQKEIRSTGGNILDFLFDGIFSARSAVKQLEKSEAYYLVMNEEKAQLVRIQKDLSLSYEEITNAVKQSSGKKYFNSDGYQYKLFRKII